ncbi:MAG: hypothetical protein K8T89_21625 [Planctomycetes bacterium]|nr:hypothetical protein [Planctomycetota bacterium]
MPKTIDWMYNRKACITCKRARDWLGETECAVTQWEDANKVKLGPKQALDLLKSLEKMVAMKGKKVVTFDLKIDRPDDDTLLAHLIGPTGNLRAPTLKIGNTLLVGFNEVAYNDYLG